MPPPSQLIGATSRRYLFAQLIQERPHLGCVWVAKCGSDKFIIKDVPEPIMSHFNEDLLPRLPECPNIRLPYDTIPNRETLVYRYLTDDFLTLVRKRPSIQARKQILKASLRGIAELHSRDIVHLDVKPDKIMVNTRASGPETTIEKVQVIDLENVSHLPKGRYIEGMLAGNDDFRGPEAHCRGELNKPTDIFSFATVCIYAMLGNFIFGRDEDMRLHESRGIFPHVVRLQRQVSYFGDKAGLDGLMAHVDDVKGHREVLRLLYEDRVSDDHSYRPFEEWPDIKDDGFKDVIGKMTSLDPRRRATASELLEHSWFSGYEID